jgi:ribonuclease HI
MRSTPVDNTKPRTLSSDGSLINNGQPDIAMAFGVVDQSQPVIRTVQGRTDGFASSTKAELMGLIAAVLSAPPEQHIIVELDNQAVVQQYQQLVKTRADALPRMRLRSNYAGHWAVLHKMVQDRGGTVKVRWVRGHRDNVGNNLADKVATTAVKEDTVPWMVDLSSQQDIRHFAHCHSTRVEVDLRQVLKQQTTIRRHQAWTTQRRVKRAIPDLDDVEWRSTLGHVHDNKSVYTFYSNAKDTSQRTHHMKKLHGMLPTLNVMRARHPDLYQDSICCVCEAQEEDNGHVWTCHETAGIQKDIWEEGLRQIDIWGQAATIKHNKDARKRYERDIGKGKPNTQAPTPIMWVPPERKDHVQGLASIGGTQRMLIGEHCYDRAPDLTWTISDLCRAITPKSLLKEWSRFFQTPISIANKVIHKFVGHVERQASEQIWKPRCKKTVAVEKQLRITLKMKKQPYRGPRRNWSEGYGYSCAEGYCPCGSLLEDHTHGECPGPRLDPEAADRALLENLLGRRKLTTMEGMGKIPFL